MIYTIVKLFRWKMECSPVNAGNIINTDGKEVFPYIDKEGTLYFASDNPSGMGGLDLYKSKGSKNKWSKTSKPWLSN